MQWQYMRIFNVLNARILISEGVRTVLRQWVSNKLQVPLNLKNSFAPIAAKFQLIIVLNMEMISSNLSAGFVVQLLNGSAGETLTFVNPVTRDSAMVIMWVNIQRINSLNAKGLVNAQQEVTTMGMETKKVWDAQFVAILRPIIKLFDLSYLPISGIFKSVMGLWYLCPLCCSEYDLLRFILERIDLNNITSHDTKAKERSRG